MQFNNTSKESERQTKKQNTLQPAFEKVASASRKANIIRFISVDNNFTEENVTLIPMSHFLFVDNRFPIAD